MVTAVLHPVAFFRVAKRLSWGYFVSEDGVLYGDHAYDFDCFEYYDGKLEENNRLLHYVSLYLKDENDIDLPALLNMQCRIVAEHHLKYSFHINSHGAYIRENLLAENRLTADEKEQLIKSDGLMPWIPAKLSIHHISFLAKERGMDKEAVQLGLTNGGG
jgi:hypothetical protein